jgi:hypothetical protein
MGLGIGLLNLTTIPSLLDLSIILIIKNSPKKLKMERYQLMESELDMLVMEVGESMKPVVQQTK